MILHQVVALSRGADKKELATKLGASVYIDTEAQNPVEELKKLGGADVIMATASSGKAMSPLVGAYARACVYVCIAASKAFCLLLNFFPLC